MVLVPVGAVPGGGETLESLCAWSRALLNPATVAVHEVRALAESQLRMVGHQTDACGRRCYDGAQLLEMAARTAPPQSLAQGRLPIQDFSKIVHKFCKLNIEYY